MHTDIMIAGENILLEHLKQYLVQSTRDCRGRKQSDMIENVFYEDNIWSYSKELAGLV